MAIVTKKCYYSNLPKAIYFYFYSRQRVASTQYLDMVKILPQLLKPIQRKLLKIKKNLESGIAQVQKANTFINKLSNEISEKEPEILKLSTEIEQFNKRLSQERINLERARYDFT